MFKKIVLVVLSSVIFVGCASVPMASKEKSAAAKKFSPPSNGNAGLYIYRAGSFGGALKKDVWVNGKCVGETAPNIFFHLEVEGDKSHKLSTESEFSPNDLLLDTKSGENYFVQQYIKMGAFVGGAGLKKVNSRQGKEVVRKLELAKQGNCSR